MDALRARGRRARRVRHARRTSTRSARRCPPRAGWRCWTGRRVGEAWVARGRLRQRVPLRQPAARRAAGDGRARARDLHGHVQQGALSRPAGRAISSSRRPLWQPFVDRARRARHLLAQPSISWRSPSSWREGHFARHLRQHARRLPGTAASALLTGLARHCSATGSTVAQRRRRPPRGCAAYRLDSTTRKLSTGSPAAA